MIILWRTVYLGKYFYKKQSTHSVTHILMSEKKTICLPFRLLFGGSLPHYFYGIMEKILTSRKGLKQILFFTTERLIYTPMFQAISLYSLAILEVIIWKTEHTKIFKSKSDEKLNHFLHPVLSNLCVCIHWYFSFRVLLLRSNLCFTQLNIFRVNRILWLLKI